MAAYWGAATVIGSTYLNNTGSTTQSGTKRTILDQEAYDQIVTDILSDEQGGLAALSINENLSGGYGSSTKTLSAQQMVTNAAGQLSQIVGTRQQGGTSKKEMSTICTECVVQGQLDMELYARGLDHFESLHPYTIEGYFCWAETVSQLMHKYPAITKIIAPIVRARYEHIANDNPNIVGGLTVYIGEPVCTIIGAISHLLQSSDQKESYGNQ